jgi:hypothetical protein
VQDEALVVLGRQQHLAVQLAHRAGRAAGGQGVQGPQHRVLRGGEAIDRALGAMGDFASPFPAALVAWLQA